MSDEIGKSSPAALGDEWEASGCQVRLSARPDFAIAYCATERGAARVAAALNAAPLGQARGAEGETVSALRSSLAKAEAALAAMREERDGEQRIAIGWEKKAEDLEIALAKAEEGLEAARNALLKEGLARAKAEAERDEARVVLSNISGALVDSGLPVPAEKDYHQAVRALTAERDRLREALRGLTAAVEAGDLIRCTARDDEPDFLRRSMELVMTLKRAFDLTAPVVAQSAGDSSPSAHGAAAGSEGQKTNPEPGEGKP